MTSHLSARARISLALFDAFSCVTIAAILSCAFVQPAFAYVDPSVMTYTIQAIAGVAVALGAVAGVAFRRGRRAIMRTFNIDENAHKEVEGLVHRLDEQNQPILTETELAEAETGEEGKKSKRKKKRSAGVDSEQQLKRARLSWPSRLWRSCLASILLVGTVLLVAPVEMVAASSESLAFTLADVWNPILMNACIVAACLALVMSLFWGKGFDLIFSIVVALGLCFYLQAMLFNQTLPAADGAPFYLEDHLRITVLSTIGWVAILFGAIFLFAKLRFANRTVGVFVCLALIIMQGAAVTSIYLDAGNQGESQHETSSASTSAIGDAVITKEGLYEVSPKNNIVVFVLDTYDIIDLDGLIEWDSEILEEMTGFTYFSNSTGSSTPTRYGVPFLLTGIWPSADETWDQYLDRRYPASTFTDDIVKQGYSLYVYTDTPGRGGLQHLNGLATNVHPYDATRTLTNTTFNMEGALRMIYIMALYRDMPWLAKEYFWFYTDAVNQAAFDVEVYEEEVSVSGRTGADSPYVLDDAAFYKQLTNRRLSIYDDGAKGSVHFIHMVGVHHPYVLDEYGQRSTETVNRDQQARGSMRAVSEYLKQMKELGVYDDATIIITADHGMWAWKETIERSEQEGNMAGGPIMLVKPAGTAEQSAQPCKVSEVRTGHIDFCATVIDAVGGNTAKYGPTVFQVDDPNRLRYYYWPTHDGTTDFIIYEYEIDGEASNWYAWRRTGVEWPYNKPATSTL